MKNVFNENSHVRAFILFVQTADAIMKYANSYLHKNTGISTIKFIVLKTLAANGGSMKPSEIAEWTLRERHDITTLINRMRKEGLVTSKRNRKDMRSVNIRLTENGLNVLAHATPVAMDIINHVMAEVNESDAMQLEKLLGGLREKAHDGLENAAKRSSNLNQSD